MTAKIIESSHRFRRPRTAQDVIDALPDHLPAHCAKELKEAMDWLIARHWAEVERERDEHERRGKK